MISVIVPDLLAPSYTNAVGEPPLACSQEVNVVVFMATKSASDVILEAHGIGLGRLTKRLGGGGKELERNTACSQTSFFRSLSPPKHAAFLLARKVTFIARIFNEDFENYFLKNEFC